MRLRLICLLFLFISALYGQAQVMPSLEFEDINQSGIPVTALFQNDLGQVYVCTTEGMYIYDGVDLRRNKGWLSSNITSSIIRCFYKITSEQYYVGCEDGLYLFDLLTDSFTIVPGTSGVDVRAIAKINDTTLLFGTMSGVVEFDMATGYVEKVDEVPPYPVVSFQYNEEKEILYISSNNGFFEYNLSFQTYSFVPLPIKNDKSYLIHIITYDKTRNCLWVGAEKRFLRYDISKREFEEKLPSENNTIYVITIDSSGNILLGTDRGIRKYNEKGDIECLSDILLNAEYVIWSILEDKKGNIWIGTDGGLSVYKNDPFVQIHRWKDMIGSTEGNRITCIFKDSRENYWFGGTTGLGRLAPGKSQIDWYKSGSRFHISHDRIQNIYEDNDGDLWVATNKSINLFNYDKEVFTHYTIMDSTQTRSTDWSIDIIGDEDGQLWITSFMGGVFRVNKHNLIANKSNRYLAEENCHQHSQRFALSSNRVQNTVRDKQGNIWVSTHGYGLNKIDFATGNVIIFAHDQPERSLLSNIISAILCDADGFIWVAQTGGLQKINPQTDEIITIKNDLLNSAEIFSITEKDDFLWITTSDGLFALNKNTYNLLHMTLEGKRYMCSFYDEQQGRIYIGGNNHYISFNPDSVLNEIDEAQPAIFTTLYINDEAVLVGVEYDGNRILNQSFAYTNQIILKHHQNNLAIQLTDNRYNQIIKSEYQYKLENADKNWHTLDITSNKITYTNLNPGKYNLIIQQTNTAGNAVAIRSLAIHVLQPWYNTILAKTIYVILLIGILMLVINYFRVRNNLKIKCLNKEKALELSEMKMEFLTNISHELKTPLSLIISLLNRLMSTAKNTQSKKQVEVIHQNAMRLSSLVNQIIDSSHEATFKDDVLLSKLEIVEFSRSIFNMYKETFEKRGIDMRFKTNISTLYINVDIFKMESVINNLLSNAGKFSEKDGIITLELYYDNVENESQLSLTVSDTGIGIPSKDIPYVFDRFYQSENNLYKNKDGSGIGLAMVKKYTELHHGTIDLDSEVGKGTAITITLPVDDIIEVEAVISSSDNSSISEAKVLIVEDNVEIAHFLAENLKGMVCIITYNGKSGYEMAQEQQPDIIITDIMMPVMDGIEMCRLLKHNILTAAIPVIMLTAKEDKQTELKAYGLGIDVFIQKPFDIKQLNIRIHQIIRNKSLLVRKINQSNIIENKEYLDVNIESTEEKLLVKITEIIEEKLSDSELNVQKLAELSGFTTKQIYRRIKQLTGHTAVSYIKSIRLKKAALLLEQRKYTVSEVMYMVGFSNPSYFSKCFAEKYGETPKQYMDRK